LSKDDKIDDLLEEMKKAVDQRTIKYEKPEPCIKVEPERLVPEKDTTGRSGANVLGIAAVAVALGLLFGYLLAWVWNFTVSDIFSIGEMTAVQGIALYVTLQILRLTDPRQR